jgi:glycosyltransferase involved in cell wall biosynthesis
MLTYATASFDEPVDTLQVKAHFNIAPDTRIILSVGRLIPQKGLYADVC